MPICEFYCPENHTIYQFRAQTAAQEKIIPPCPENPQFHLVRMTPPPSQGRQNSEFLDAARGGEAACHMLDPDAPFGAASEVGSDSAPSGVSRKGPMLRDPKLYDYP